MKKEIVSYIYMGVVLLTFITSLSRYKWLDSAARIFCLFLGFSFITECVGFYTAKRFHSNFEVYAIYNIAEICFIACYFNYSVEAFKKYRVGIMIAIAGALFGILNIVFIQSLKSINDYFLFFEGFLIIAMCLFAFFSMWIHPRANSILASPHFWITSIILFYKTYSYLYWGLFEYFRKLLGKEMWKMEFAMIVIGTLMYVAIGVIYYLIPSKLRVSE